VSRSGTVAPIATATVKKSVDLTKVNTLYIFRPLATYGSHDKILQKCKKLRKEYEGMPGNQNYEDSIPQIRDFWEEFQHQLDQKGKWWGDNWSRYAVKYADLEKAIHDRDFELFFYRNLLIIKFARQASAALKEVMFYKALETELEVVPE
jgi:hypothetical protein